MELQDLKEGQELRLTTNIGAVGYAHCGELQFRELEEGTVVSVNKIVEDLHLKDGRWSHTVIVSLYEDAVDEDGEEVEISFTALVGAQYLEELEINE